MARAGRTLDVLIKVDVGFHRCGIDPDGDALGFVQRVSALPGLRLRGLLSHAGHGYHASSDDELRGVAHHEAEILTSLRDRAVDSRHRARGAIRRRDADAALQRRRAWSDGTASRQLRVLRPHAGRARSGDARRLRADGARDRGRSRHDGRIILDCGSKTLTNDQARGITAAPGYGAVLTARRRGDRRPADDRAPVGRACDGARDRRHGLEAGRSRAHRAESLVRRVEPGERGAAGRRRTRN